MTHPAPTNAGDLRTVCLCCGKPIGAWRLYNRRAVCFDCVESGKLLDCLIAEMHRSMVTSPQEAAHE